VNNNYLNKNNIELFTRAGKVNMYNPLSNSLLFFGLSLSVDNTRLIIWDLDKNIYLCSGHITI